MVKKILNTFLRKKVLVATIAVGIIVAFAIYVPITPDGATGANFLLGLVSNSAAPVLSNLWVGTPVGNPVQYQCIQNQYCIVSWNFSQYATGYTLKLQLKNSAGQVVSPNPLATIKDFNIKSYLWPVGGTALGKYKIVGIIKNSLGTTVSTLSSNEFNVIAGTQQTISVRISPNPASVQVLKTQAFTATVTGTTNTGVTWTKISGYGSIDQSGVYTAPSTQTTAVIKATSKADNTKSDTATITVTTAPPPPPSSIQVTVNPSTAFLLVNQKQQFTATVTGTTNTGVTWTKISGYGIIDQSGIYTAPSIKTTAVIKATSKADSSKYGTATITVNVGPLVGNSTKVFLSNPNGGESIPRNLSYIIHWTTDKLYSSTDNVGLSLYKGRVFKSAILCKVAGNPNLTSTVSVTLGGCDWTPSTSLIPGNDYQVKINFSVDSSYDYSANYFSIY